MKEIKVQKAFEMIEQVCAATSLSRDGHIRLQQALELIKEEIEKKDEKSKT